MLVTWVSNEIRRMFMNMLQEFLVCVILVKLGIQSLLVEFEVYEYVTIATLVKLGACLWICYMSTWVSGEIRRMFMNMLHEVKLVECLWICYSRY
jgi:hypothetical protein